MRYNSISSIMSRLMIGKNPDFLKKKLNPLDFMRVLLKFLDFFFDKIDYLIFFLRNIIFNL